MSTIGRRMSRAFFARDPLVVARDLLGRVLVADSPPGRVAVRLTEVEAYHGLHDPASHAFRGRTARTAVMFGPAGHLYVYFVYGMHWCANIVTGSDGEASAVLLRAGEVVAGHDLAARRRPSVSNAALLGRGPAGLTTILGIDGHHTGSDVIAPASTIRVCGGSRTPDAMVGAGPRVGVAAAADKPWRFWQVGEPSVSAYRAGGAKRSRDRLER